MRRRVKIAVVALLPSGLAAGVWAAWPPPPGVAAFPAFSNPIVW
jgi:hypothetical protein